MGNQHNTHVANGFGKPVTVTVTHPGDRNDMLVIGDGEVRNVATNHGQVLYILIVEVKQCIRRIQLRYERSINACIVSKRVDQKGSHWAIVLMALGSIRGKVRLYEILAVLCVS